MAFLPWQQVSAPNNSTAASFMKLAMQGVENAGTSFSEAAKGAADIQKNKADLAREKANALLTGQVLNAPDSEAASKLMQDALTASGDSGLFNTQSLRDAQTVRKSRIDTESAEVKLDYDTQTLDDRVKHEKQRTITNDQVIEQNENALANTAATDAVNAMAPAWKTAYLDTGSLPSTKVMESMLDEYFKANNIDPNSNRAQLIRTKFASQAVEKVMATALEVDGQLNPEQAAVQGKKIADGTPDVGPTATIDVLNKTGSPEQVVSGAVTRMAALGKTADGKEWDEKTTGAASPQEWESKLLMLAGKHSIPAGQLQMLLNMGFRDASDESGFVKAAKAAQQQYIENKEFEAKYSNTEKELAEITGLRNKEELRLKALLLQDGTLTAKQIAEKKAEIDEWKKAEEKLKTVLTESELGRWRDPLEVKVAKEELEGKGITVKDFAVDFLRTSAPLLHPAGGLLSIADTFTRDTKGSEEVKGVDLLTDSKVLDRWREGDVKNSEIRIFASHVAKEPELNEKYSNWYDSNIIQASKGDKKAINKLSLAANPAIKAFMQHYAIVSESDDATRAAELGELNTDRIVNELTQKALSDKGMTPVEPVNLSGSRGANTSIRNPDPAGSTTVQLRPGVKLEASIRPVVNDYFQKTYGRPVTDREWKANHYDLISAVGDNKTLDDEVSSEIVIPNELIERLFNRQS